MRLRKNPFYLLEVTPEDSIEKINEAAENKSFIDDKNEQLYEEARLVLSSPSKRIAAEIRYIFSDSSDDGMVSLFYDPSEERISIDDFLRNPYDCFYEDDNRYSCYEELIRGVEWLYLDNYCSDADEDEDSVELDEQDFANFIAVIAEQYSYLLDSDNVKELTKSLFTEFIEDENFTQIITDLVELSEAFNGLEPDEFETTVRENIIRLKRCYQEKDAEKLRQQYKQVNDDEIEALKIQMQLRDKIKLRNGEK